MQRIEQRGLVIGGARGVSSDVARGLVQETLW